MVSERTYTTAELADWLDRLQRQHDEDIKAIRQLRSEDIAMVQRAVERVQTDFLRVETYKSRHDALRASIEGDVNRLNNSVNVCRAESEKQVEKLRTDVKEWLATLRNDSQGWAKTALEKADSSALLAKISIVMLGGTILTALFVILQRAG